MEKKLKFQIFKKNLVLELASTTTKQLFSQAKRHLGLGVVHEYIYILKLSVKLGD
jgi:hypothetical protein